MQRVAIVDYGMGNLPSVANALAKIGAQPCICDEPEGLQAADRVILPGVGAFAKAMERLDEAGFSESLRRLTSEGKPLLGICLGMQLLAERGAEFGERTGLGLLPGSVEPLPLLPETRIPRMGWAEVTPARQSWVLTGAEDFYFAHSFYYAAPDEIVLGTSQHGGDVPVAVGRGCVAGVQFHPEKSHAAGLGLLKRFLEWRP